MSISDLYSIPSESLSVNFQLYKSIEILVLGPICPNTELGVKH